MSHCRPEAGFGRFLDHGHAASCRFRATQGVRYAKDMRESGFTTVRDVGNANDDLDADLEKAIRFGSCRVRP
jgi:hypothetical protein